MKKNDNLYEYLKTINVPNVENEEHYNSLRNKLLLEIQKADAEQVLTTEKTKINAFFKLSFTAAFITVFLIGAFFIFNKYIGRADHIMNSCVATTVTGDVNILSPESNTPVKLKPGSVIKEHDTILTGEDSTVVLTIGDKSLVHVEADARLQVLELLKKADMENTGIKLIQGLVFVKPSLPNNKSGFVVETDTTRAYVTGTEFSVEVDEDQNTNVMVNEGSVKVKPKITLKQLKKLQKEKPELAAAIEHEILGETVVLPGEKITVVKSDVVDTTQTLSALIEEINTDDSFNNTSDKTKLITHYKTKIKNNPKIFKRKEKFKQTQWALFIKNKKHAPEKEDKTDEQEPTPLEEALVEKEIVPEVTAVRTPVEQFSVVAFKNTVKTSLHENKTAVSHDAGTIYICSDNDKTVYAINAVDGSLKWRFSHKDLNNIISPLSVYKNSLILSTPNTLFVLNTKGMLKKSMAVNRGTNYWASPVIANNMLLIPTSQDIYTFTNNTFAVLENFTPVMGQLYITAGTGRLFYTSVDTKRLMVYDFKTGATLLQSDDFDTRAFTAPLLTGKYVIVADMNGNLYKFDAKNLTPEYEKTSISAGIMSDPVYDKGVIYFVANDGYFYKGDADFSNGFNKVVTVDNNPDPNTYLIKKLVKHNNDLYFCSDTGKLFRYDLIEQKSSFIELEPDTSTSLIGLPVIINNAIFVVDTKAQVTKIIKNY